MTPARLEALLRSYSEFRELYEQKGIEEITLPDGLVVNIHDLLRGIDDLPKRQKTALVLTTLYNLKEVEAAPLMNFHKWTSPVSSYKKLALTKLCEKYWSSNDSEIEAEAL